MHQIMLEVIVVCSESENMQSNVYL